MEVSNNIELIDNINSNTEIKLKSADYNISNLILENDDNVYYNEVFDGKELIVKNITNLKLIGEGDNVNILADPRYANVITFIGCTNIEISNLFLGHIARDGGCTGGVLKFINCANINISNCNLFGCGRIGIETLGCMDFNINSTNIYECSEGILSLTDTMQVAFNECNFYENKGQEFFKIQGCKNIKFKECNIYNNFIEYEWGGNLFDIIDAVVVFNETTIENNIVNSISNKRNEKVFENIKLTNNIFKSGEIFSNRIKNKSEEIIEENLDNGYKLVYGDESEIKLIKEISIDTLACKPKVSPNKSRLIYISPYEWEVLGDLYLCNLSGENTKSEVILSAKKVSEIVAPMQKIKVAKWKNNDELYLIIGQGYGTVSEGGDLYTYDIIKNKLSIVYKCDDREEVVNFEVNKDEINLTIVKFNKELEPDKYILKVIKL